VNKISLITKSKIVNTLLCCFLFCFTAIAQNGFNAEEFLKPPSGIPKLVTDATNTLTPEQLNALEQKLVRIDDSSSTQIAVIIIPNTGGRSISEYNQELGRSWGVGDKRFNNGVILLIAKEDRKLDIASGYGLEGALTDYTAQHIIDDIIVPNFKGNDYYRGIDEGTDAIIAVVEGKYNAPRQKGGGGMSMGRIIMMIVVIIVLLSLFSGGNNKGGTFMSRRGSRGLSGPIFWPTGGGWGGGSSSGGGGGGFGGFGGGSFGGGGASGSW
jgi:uncharacterized protein